VSPSARTSWSRYRLVAGEDLRGIGGADNEGYQAESQRPLKVELR